MITAEKPVTNVSQQQGIASRTGRIQSVDAIRGAIIILMALDHVRDFVSSAAMSFSPTDLTQTTTFIFFTRWITHFCAPVFAFTAGIGAFFWGRGKTKAQLSRFLLTRGLWLVLLEVTVLRCIFYFQVRFYRVPRVVCGDWDVVSALPMVCPTETAQARLVVELPVRSRDGCRFISMPEPGEFLNAQGKKKARF